MRYFIRPCLLLAALSSSQALAESSMETRQKKTVMIEGHLGFNGMGAGLGIFLKDDSRLDISVSRGDIFYHLDYLDNVTQKIEFQSFVANSFYYALGLNRRVARDHLYFYSPDSVDSEGTSTLEALHAHIAIGNEWSFRTFFIGAEWVGMSTPIQSSYRIDYPASATAQEREREDKAAARNAKQTVVIFPNLYIGFAF